MMPGEPTAAVRAVMRANRSRDTGPELAIRRELHRRGLRYRVALPVKLHGKRRTIDVAFTRARLAVLVDGCFWHGCPEHYRPATGVNSQFWTTKVEQNRARDAETTRLLSDAGWRVTRFWEHHDPIAAASEIERAVRPSAHLVNAVSRSVGTFTLGA